MHNQKQELHTKMWGKRCPELTILWPRKQSFLKGFTRGSPHGRCQDEVHTSRPQVFRRALLHSQPRSPTPTIPKHAVERGINLHTGPAKPPFVPHAQRPQANSSIVEGPSKQTQPSLPSRSEQKRATASSALESQGFGLCFPFITAVFRRQSHTKETGTPGDRSCGPR